MPNDLDLITQLEQEIGSEKIVRLKKFHSWSITGYIIDDNQQVVGLSLNELALNFVPQTIFQLTNLKVLDLSENRLTTLPPEIIQLKSLKILNLEKNPLKQPPPEIVAKGITAIFEYLWQLAGALLIIAKRS